MAAVKFRGLDPRTGMARWGLAAVAIGIVVGVTAPAAARGLATVVEANPQSLVWLFERLFAWLAYLAMAGSVIYGLLLSTKLLDAIAHRPISFSLHQDLAAIGLGLAGDPRDAAGLDHSVPFTFAQILVPGLVAHAPVAVAFGQVALYLMAAVTASFYLRRHIGQRAWRTFHYLTFLVFVGVTVHGIAAGSDSNAPWAQAIYLGSAALVLFLLHVPDRDCRWRLVPRRELTAPVDRFDRSGRPRAGARCSPKNASTRAQASADAASLNPACIGIRGPIAPMTPACWLMNECPASG